MEFEYVSLIVWAYVMIALIICTQIDWINLKHKLRRLIRKIKKMDRHEFGTKVLAPIWFIGFIIAVIHILYMITA